MKKIRIIIAIIVFCFCFAGCNKNEMNKNKENKTNPENITEGNKDSNTELEKDFNTNIENHSNQNNGNDSISNENADLSNNTNDISNVSIKEEIEKFDEIMIPFDSRIKSNNERYKSLLMNAEKKIEVYTMSSTENRNSSFIWRYTLSDNEWNREVAVWLEGLRDFVDQGRIKVLFGEDGNYYATYVTSDEMHHLVKKNGDSYDRIPINHWEDKSLAFGVYMIPDNIGILENGNIVMASRTKKCYVYDKNDGSTIAEFKCGWYTTMAVSKNNVIITDPDNKSVMVYNTDTLEITHTLDGNFGVNTSTCADNDSIYVCNTSGFYKNNLKSSEWIKFMRGGVTLLTDDSLEREKWFVADNTYYVVYWDNDAKLIQYKKTDPNAAPKEELVIYSLYTNKAVRSAITDFKLLHPEIDVIYETGETSVGASTIADSIRALNTEILAGKGPDIIIMDGLSMDTYINKGILMNLNELIDEISEDLFGEVVSAYRKGNDIYTIPIRIGLPMFFTAKECSEAVNSFKTLVEYSEKEGGNLLGDITYDELMDFIYKYYTPDIITDNKSVNKEVLQEYLELFKRFVDTEDVREQPENKYGYVSKGSGYRLLSGEDKIYLKTVNGIVDIATLPDIISRIGGSMIPVKDKFEPYGLIGINQASKKKDLAIEFFKLAFSEEVQKKDLSNGFPIRISALNSFSDKDYSNATFAWGSSLEDIKSARFVSGSEAMELIQQVKMVKTPLVSDEIIRSIIKEESMPYLKGTKNLETTVNLITNRLELYLFEQE